MKRMYGLLIVLAVSFAGLSPARERWQDPEVFAVNRLPAHAFTLAFPDAQSAAPEPDWANPYAGSSRFQLLNGNWAFRWSSNLDEAPAGFHRPGFDVSGWDAIPVPSPWQIHGFGQLYYFNSFHPYLADPRNPELPKDTPRRDPARTDLAEAGWVPTVFNPVGSYRHTFTVPDEWNDMRVILHFGGVQSAFTCWVNGREVGYSQDSFTPAEFDITDYLKAGVNELAVQVIRWSDGAYLENQDMIRMSGILRDVMLIARPPLHIADFCLVPLLDPSQEQGALNARVSLLNAASEASGPAELELVLLDESGRPVGRASAPSAPLRSGDAAELVLPELELSDPRLWHPEDPRLYTVLLTLKENGRVREVLRQDTAFRRFDRDDRGNLHLNGRRFYLRGVNRHETSEETGRTVSYAEMLQDARLMKRLNINTVRTSHYPDDPRWVALCARYGIAVIDECNLETHSVEVLMDDEHPEWRAQALFRMRNMVLRDRSQPAVLIWSLGNEQFRGWPRTIQEMARLTRELDPTRGIMAERAWDYRENVIRGEGLIDFVAPMYGGNVRAGQYLEHWNRGERRPFFFCEYAHCMGNSMSELADKWAFQEEHDGLNGGCIWDWADQALLLPLPGLPGRHWTYGGDWGDCDSDRIFCANGIVLPDRSIQTSKPAEVKAVYQQAAFAAGSDPATVRITNKFATHNLRDFDLKWTLLRNGAPLQSGILTPDVPPLASREIRVPFELPAAQPGDRFDLNFDLALRSPERWADAGYEIAQGQVALDVKTAEPAAFSRPPGKLQLDRSASSVTVSGQGFVVVFDRTAGTLSQYRLNGEDLLAADAALGGIELNPYSAATDDRKQWPTREQREAYKQGLDKLRRAQKDLRVVGDEPDRVIVETTADYLAPGGEGLRHTAWFSVFADGTIQVDNYVQKINLPANSFLIRLGVRIPLDRRLGQSEYAGLGPLACYSDRKAAARYGQYALPADGFYENYIRPQDCGNREEVDWIAAKDPRTGTGLVVASNDRFSSSIMPWMDEQMDRAEHRAELPKSTRSILRFDARMSGIAKGANVNFEGDAAFSYSIRPLRAGAAAAAVARAPMPPELMRRIALTGIPLNDHPVPEGWVNVSDKASVTYSSISPKWSIHNDTLLTTQRTPFSFHSEEEMNPWLIVDLGESRPVAAVQIANRLGPQSNRTRNLHVWLSSDGESWKPVFAGGEPKPMWDIRLPSPESARFVKIGLVQPNPVFFHLKGVRVYATR